MFQQLPLVLTRPVVSLSRLASMVSHPLASLHPQPDLTFFCVAELGEWDWRMIVIFQLLCPILIVALIGGFDSSLSARVSRSEPFCL
jgi:hypothetical protein